jgi:hypothetical protein
MFQYNRTRITGTLHEGQYAFLNTSRSIFLEPEMFRQNM